MECASHPPVGAPSTLGAPHSPLPSLSPLIPFLLGHSDVIQRPRQEQLHSEPAFPPSLSLSLNLFLSFLCTSRGMQGEARQGRGGRSDTIGVFFCPEKKGAIASHLLLSPLYCTMVQAGWVQRHDVLVLRGQQKETTAYKHRETESWAADKQKSMFSHVDF